MPDPDCAAAGADAAGGGSRDRSHGRIDSAIHASWRGRTGDERNAVSDIELDMQYFYHSKNVPSSLVPNCTVMWRDPNLEIE